MSAEKVMHTVREAVTHLKQRYAQRATGKSSGKIQGIGRGEKSSVGLAKRPHPLRNGRKLGTPRLQAGPARQPHHANLPQRALQVAQLRFLEIDTGADHSLIRTIRGVGYQIGGNHRAG
jgi:hypothetical protein